MSYLVLKHIHITCVVLSGLGFCLRGWWMLTESAMRQHRLTRIWPHFIDTLLLGSALTMAWMSGQYPFVYGWLTAKLFGLLAYIVLGAMALRRGGRGKSASVISSWRCSPTPTSSALP